MVGYGSDSSIKLILPPTDKDHLVIILITHNVSVPDKQCKEDAPSRQWCTNSISEIPPQNLLLSNTSRRHLNLDTEFTSGSIEDTSGHRPGTTTLFWTLTAQQKLDVIETENDTVTL